MKKGVIVGIAALLILAVCFSAGCLSSPTDPIVGTWTASDEDTVMTETFNADGTGTAAAVVADGTLTADKFDWFNMGTVYTFIYSDGTSASTTYDSVTDTLKTPSGLVFTRQKIDSKEES